MSYAPGASPEQVIVVREILDGSAPEFGLMLPPRENRFWADLLSTGLSCSAAVLGWIVVFGGAGAAPVTGGASTVISALEPIPKLLLL